MYHRNTFEIKQKTSNILVYLININIIKFLNRNFKNYKLRTNVAKFSKTNRKTATQYFINKTSVFKFIKSFITITKELLQN